MVCSLSVWVCVSVCLWTTLGHSHSSIFIDIYLNLHHLYKHIPNYMPIVFQGHRLKFKVTGVKTLSFLAHFWLVQTKYQNHSLKIAVKVPINHLLVSSKNPIDFEDCRSKVKVTGVKTLSFLVHFRLVRTKTQKRMA